MSTVQSLEELVAKAEEAQGQATVYLNESEIPMADVPLGDEDSIAGDGLRLKVNLTLETGGEKHTFTKEYRDDLLYQEDMKLVNLLREKVPFVNEGQMNK